MSGSLFDDWFAKGMDPAAYDPVAAARQGMATPLPGRFYKEVGASPVEGGFALTLDGRTAKTPGRKPLVLPTRALAQLVAAEWAAQGEKIDPKTMPMTRLANAIVDGVAPDPAPTAAEIVKFAGSDLLCYRAGEPDGLVARQAEAWDPILAWAREAIGARFVLSEGVMFVEQPERALAAVAEALPRDGWRIGAMSVVTTLTGSALLALALARGAADRDAVWAAAHVDEVFQEALWGADEEALARRAARRLEFDAAAAMLAALG